MTCNMSVKVSDRQFHPAQLVSFQELFCDLCLVQKFDLHLCFMIPGQLRGFFGKKDHL